MSPEPKPRSMAAVTITVNRMGATAQWPLPNLAKCWNIRVSPGTFLNESDNPWSADNQQERPQLRLQN